MPLSDSFSKRCRSLLVATLSFLYLDSEVGSLCPRIQSVLWQFCMLRVVVAHVCCPLARKPAPRSRGNFWFSLLSIITPYPSLTRRVLGRKETLRPLKPWSTGKLPWLPRVGEILYIFSAFAKPNARLDEV